MGSRLGDKDEIAAGAVHARVTIVVPLPVELRHRHSGFETHFSVTSSVPSASVFQFWCVELCTQYSMMMMSCWRVEMDLLLQDSTSNIAQNVYIRKRCFP